MGKQLENLMFIFPIMLYYLLESLIVGGFIYTAMKFILFKTLNIDFNYIEVVTMYWILKMVLFNVFHLAGIIHNIPENEKE